VIGRLFWAAFACAWVATWLALSIPADASHRFWALLAALFCGLVAFYVVMALAELLHDLKRKLRAVVHIRPRRQGYPSESWDRAWERRGPRNQVSSPWWRR
jgi:hypothetical protein